jgi:DNA-binding beta-propeller fold protein YncE
LTPGTSTPQVVVSPADGRIYTLDINATPKKLIIWKTDINTTPGTAIDLEITLNDPQTIAVSPDGIWLFIADGAGNQIQASKIETLKLTSPVTYSISLGESPILLVVAGNSELLYAVTNPTTGDKKVRAFHITESPVAFPEIRATTATTTGVTIGGGTPVAITASASGKWAYVVSRDSSNKGKVRAVNGEKIATVPSNAVSEPLEVITAPEDILLDLDKSSLYIAGKGTIQPGGGASVLDVKEEACQEIVWQALEGCPECPDDFCVPLAAIREYTKDKVINDADIDNRIRPLVPSTEILQKLITCALETRVTSDGVSEEDLNALKRLLEEFAAELATLRGRTDALEERVTELENRTSNLEPDLTRIVALSWVHNTNTRLNAPVLVNRLAGRNIPGFVIGFGKDTNTLTKINTSQINDRVFQVLVEKTEDNNPLLVCRCEIKGKIIPVNFELAKDESGNTIAGQIKKDSVQESEDVLAAGVAFLVSPEIINQFSEIWIKLRGDFILDEERRAIDAEFVRGELPTGDRRRDSKYGIQGGLFESWFEINPPK